MSVILPPVPAYYDEPKLDYDIAQRIQLRLDAKLGWLEKSYHIAKVGVEAKTNLTYPQVYKNDGSDEHFNIRPDNKTSSYSFIEIEAPASVDYENGTVEYSLSIVFWNNLRLIDDTKQYDYTSELIIDVIDVLQFFAASNIQEEIRPENIFDKYTQVTQNLKQHLMKMYSGFKITFNVIEPYPDSCASDPVDSCAQNIDRINSLPESVKTCVLNSVCPSGGDLQTEINEATGSELSTALLNSTNKVNQIAYRKPFSDFQGTSYNIHDEGWLISNGYFDYTTQGVRPLLQGEDSDVRDGTINDWLKLSTKTPNAFNNTNRFTNDMGGTVTDGSDGSQAGYMIDHLTGYGWDINMLVGSYTWTAHLTAAYNNSLGTYTTGWFAPTVKVYNTILNYAISTGALDYAPFNNSTASEELWTSTTSPVTTTYAVVIFHNFPAINMVGNVNRKLKTGAGNAFAYAVRNHY